jgi:phosphopentomutase
MKRAIVIVLDGVGAGAAPDVEAFGDTDQPSTLKHVWDAVGGFHAPNLGACGFLAAGGIPVDPADGAQFGRLRPLSQGGKDSVTGHWEMMGIVLDTRFPTYPDGFPIPLVKAFEREIETQTLGNRAASGTKIIEDLGELHMDTGFPIIYTSADSVFQIACHEAVVPIERLYEMCQIARRLCQAPDNVQRVIARPFDGKPGAFRRTERRKDFPFDAPKNLCDEIGDVYGVGVVPELFNGRGFRPTARTQQNEEHFKALNVALDSDARFIFANFEDFDMLFGHRNDPAGFAKCLERFDVMLGDIQAKLGEGDLLLLTADHGNDPTTASTDHSREYVPLVAIALETVGVAGDMDGFTHVATLVRRWIGLG